MIYYKSHENGNNVVRAYFKRGSQWWYRYIREEKYNLIGKEFPTLNVPVVGSTRIYNINDIISKCI